ncbi:MAG: glycosyltransferase [candidate division KSB1 bacterium]|nr:glycosyltransferase [candidate division KSB1 bacterium]MDZ7273232.1 glycosyltransferase [candidate division KSB1 bacterium]MDZ7285334.1 glycosyltransferase [candidate division KSB1 bacterium]MDZ7298366.1 glycosyltransferase [candidate division KSB1 bacterium]MDZ7309251.1 glycosyltransferase [candidate division KSB1 bacterium]
MQKTSPKVVAVILKGYPRLSETFITNEMLLLEQLGFQLHIFALRNPAEAKIHENVRRVQARVTYLPDYFWPEVRAFLKANLRLWWRRPKVYWQAFRYAAWRSLRQRSSSTIKRFAQAAYLVQNFLLLPDCKGAARAGRVDIAHFYAHFSHGPTTVAYFAKWLTGIGYSFSAHAKDIYLQEHDFLREKLLAASMVTTCTEYNRNHLQQIAGPGREILRCYHGLDTDFFCAPVKPRREGLPRILSIGRFVPKKGFPTLIQALHLLRQQGLEFRCHLIGGGELKEQLRTQIRSLGLHDCVELLPALSQHELLEYYCQADLFALACEVQSDGDRDGIPNVIVEAMAMEIPVVSTNISGIPECVDHGVTGLLVPEKNPQAFAAAMATLLRDPELARAFGRAGRAKVIREFDSRRNVEKIGNALRHALGEASAATCASMSAPGGESSAARPAKRAAAVVTA